MKGRLEKDILEISRWEGKVWYIQNGGLSGVASFTKRTWKIGFAAWQ